MSKYKKSVRERGEEDVIYLSAKIQNKKVTAAVARKLQHGKFCYYLFHSGLCKEISSSCVWLEAMFEFLFLPLFLTLLMEMKMI